MIYLASPYSDPDPDVQNARFMVACKAAGILMKRGKVVFSPIAHTHPIAKAGSLPEGWEYWSKVDSEFMGACDEMIVLKLDGWMFSVGIATEIKLAVKMRLSVSYVTMEDLQNG